MLTRPYRPIQKRSTSPMDTTQNIFEENLAQQTGSGRHESSLSEV